MSIREQYGLSDADTDRVIEMAWEDRTPFEAIHLQFGLREADVIVLMKQEMHLRNWKKWRGRVQGRSTKHRQLRSTDTQRFRSRMQKDISQNRLSKRRS